jgi:hypothetical protein
MIMNFIVTPLGALPNDYPRVLIDARLGPRLVASLPWLHSDSITVSPPWVRELGDAEFGSAVTAWGVTSRPAARFTRHENHQPMPLASPMTLNCEWFAGMITRTWSGVPPS